MALTVGFGLFIRVALVLLVFGGQIGEAVAAHLGLGDVFKTVWNVASVCSAETMKSPSRCGSGAELGCMSTKKRSSDSAFSGGASR